MISCPAITSAPPTRIGCASPASPPGGGEVLWLRPTNLPLEGRSKSGHAFWVGGSAFKTALRTNTAPTLTREPGLTRMP
jgi:hypothetical protein